MKLFPRNPDTHVVASADHGEFTVDENGAVEVPDELGALLLNLGGPGAVWEDDGRRSVRLDAERAEYLNSPRALHDLIAAQTASLAAAQAAPPTAAELREQSAKLIAAAEAAEAAEAAALAAAAEKANEKKPASGK